MGLSISHNNFLESFDNIGSFDIGECGKNKLNLFTLKINANEFDYNNLQKKLLEPMADFSLSRMIKEEYKDRPVELSQKARGKFIDYINNKGGELGELLLYCFLESHLKAPKILSKLELKTSTNHYVNGADGVHYLKLEDGNYQLIFGESKIEKNLTHGLTNAFKSINEFKEEVNANGDRKSGINYEKSLISDNIEREFSGEEKEFIKNIVYPVRQNDYKVDDAFGIFTGYEITVSSENKRLSNSDFRKKIKEEIKKKIEGKLQHIQGKIDKHNLQGHNFYIYILPFTELDKNSL
jgi:hypothetical protein